MTQISCWLVLVGRQWCTFTNLPPDTLRRFRARLILRLLLPWRRRAFARVLNTAGSVSLTRMLMASHLSRSCAPAPFLLHAMGLYRPGSCVLLWMHLCNVRAQSVPMQDLPAMPTLTPNESARFPIRVFCAMMSFVFFNSSFGEALSAELAFRILG